MLKIIIIVIGLFSLGILLSNFLFKKRDGNIIDIEEYQDPTKSFKRKLPFLIVSIAIMIVVLFFLSRLGVNIGALFQKLLSLLPIIRGLMPIWERCLANKCKNVSPALLYRNCLSFHSFNKPTLTGCYLYTRLLLWICFFSKTDRISVWLIWMQFLILFLDFVCFLNRYN